VWELMRAFTFRQRREMVLGVALRNVGFRLSAFPGRRVVLGTKYWLRSASTTSGLAQQESSFAEGASRIRNVAIVAHVDHGKTTLVDALLSSTEAKAKLNDRVMDSNDLERERGITILSKVTCMPHGDFTINLVDTPGHSDFSGEVERVLSMVDGICLVVCATEGPMPQTKYVLSKALKLGIQPVVVINKVDRPTARITEVENEVFDLFCNLEASDEQLEYKTLYSSAKDGWASASRPTSTAEMKPDMSPLLDTIVADLPGPEVASQDETFRMLVSIMESDPSVHMGKLLLTGRIASGSLRQGDKVRILKPSGDSLEDEMTVVRIMKRVGTVRYEIESTCAGDLVTLSGIVGGRVADTICEASALSMGPIPAPVLDPPTISMFFAVNDSPFAGDKEISGGTKMTTQVLRERLLKETETNVAIKLEPKSRVIDGRESFEVHGRGEMQLGILVESIRREGFELSVSPPKALFRKLQDGTVEEPIEELHIDVEEAVSGKIMEEVIGRKGFLKDSVPSEDGTRLKLVFEIPSRGLVGLRTKFIALTRGDMLMSTIFLEYQAHKGELGDARNGAIISTDEGVSTGYALTSAEARGVLFITPGQRVYTGMIIGEANRDQEVEFNVCKAKKLTNMRAAAKDENVKLTPPRIMNLEECMSFIQQDELVEVTPRGIRIRKSVLDPARRKSLKRISSKHTV